MSKATPEDYKLIFEDHRVGRLIYDDLINRFGAMPAKQGGLDRILDQFEYSGKRRVIEFITLRINQANGVKDDEMVEIPVDE